MNRQDLAKALDLSAISARSQLRDYTQFVNDDVAWQQLTKTRGAQIKRAAWKLRLLRAFKAKARRSEDYVAKYYVRWQKTTLAATNPKTEPINVPVTWRDVRMLMSFWGWRYVYLLRLYRLIELTRPRKVLEVGCGSGFFPTMLACRFPDIEFHGLELTVEGVQSAKDGQALDRLPQPLVDFSPEPVVDVTGHKRVVFHRGSAKEMPFEDNTFDLVYTVCSIEQMEIIRHAALTEIARVTGRYLANYEPFYEMNARGLQRSYIQAMDFFKGPVSELKDFGLRPVYIDDDMPQKFYMNVALVVSEK